MHIFLNVVHVEESLQFAKAIRGVGSLAGNGYVIYNIDMEKVIGTNDESSIRIVTDGYEDDITQAHPIP